MVNMKSKQTFKFTRDELQFMLDKVILKTLNGIIEYKGRCGFTINSLHHVKNIEKETPLAFQERFFLLMDIIEPCFDYARRFIKREHPDALYLFDWLCKLYCDEIVESSSTQANNHVE